MRILICVFAALCLLTTASALQAATAYTDATAFTAAVAEQGLNFVICLDSQASGSSANSFGMLKITADGLQSDGSTRTAVQLVVTDTYSTTSGQNAIGASGSGDQFLAGNGDKIVFNLSHPVNAFGVRLIGNPSPTGTPAVPFWRMHANTGSGFDALSATEPFQILSKGNETYFLGIVSEEAFDQIELYSDNDPAAVFSFNVDDISVAADVKALNLAQAKSSEPQAVVIPGIVVTRVHSDRFNVETQDRACGLAIMGSGATRGKEISAFGELLCNAEGERVLNLIHLIDEYDPEFGTPAPLGMTNRSVGGGSPAGFQIGCDGGMGLNNIGLDVTIWGEITDIASDFTWMTIDDGSRRDNGTEHSGIKIVGSINAQSRQVGDRVKVQGSSSIFKSGVKYYPAVRVAQSSDITGI
ncbi:MAG: hypothetical protein ABFD46_01125 [Armatimonadota bacterium]